MKIVSGWAVAALLLSACQQAPSTSTPDAVTTPPTTAAPVHKIRFLMNSGFSGANAWMVLADERGYFRDENLQIEFVPGRGAFTAAGRMVAENFDAGYGDIQATYEQAAKHPGQAPVGVYMVMDTSPSVIILPATSAVTTPMQLAGRTLSGHSGDVALNTFAQFGVKTGLDINTVKVVTSEGNWKILIGLLDEHKADGLFGYLSTSSAAIRTEGGDVGKRLRFLMFRDVVPELYGSSLMVSPKLLREQPEVARGLVKAVNRGVMDMLCKPDEAIAALIKRDPKQNASVELGRLRDTIDDMGGRAWIGTHGVGDVAEARMQAGLTLTASARKLPREPTLAEVFNRDLLPASAQRMPCLGFAESR